MTSTTKKRVSLFKAPEDPKDAIIRLYKEEIERLNRQVTEAKDRMLHDSKKMKELKEMLDPLGIEFDGDISAVRVRLKEMTESLQKDTEMVKEEKERMRRKLSEVEEELNQDEAECVDLLRKVRDLEAKVSGVNGENALLLRTKFQQEQLLAKSKELLEQKARADQLKETLAKTEATCAEAFADYNAINGELAEKAEKLEKFRVKVGKLEEEMSKIRTEKDDDLCKLRDAVSELAKELKLRKTVVDNFVPRRLRKELEPRVRYDPELDSYFLKEKEDTPTPEPPQADVRLNFPLINSSRIPTSELRPMEGVFFKNRNVLLLSPELPSWPVENFRAEGGNPRVDAVVQRAIADLKKEVIINCDHKGRTHKGREQGSPLYYAIGSSLLLRLVPGRGNKFLDFTEIPPDTELPPGAEILPLDVPTRKSNGTKFSKEELKAFVLLKYSQPGHISFKGDAYNYRGHALPKGIVQAKETEQEQERKRRSLRTDKNRNPPNTSSHSLDFMEAGHQECQGRGADSGLPPESARLLERLHYFASK